MSRSPSPVAALDVRPCPVVWDPRAASERFASKRPMHVLTVDPTRAGSPPATFRQANARGLHVASGHAAHRAMRFILLHLDEPLSIDRIARAASLSVRTLHRLVVREYGVSPMALIRLARLSMASAELRAAAPGTTVTGVALRWGFTHLGRFARDYARQFGEAPSGTLRLARHGMASTSESRSVVQETWGRQPPGVESTLRAAPSMGSGRRSTRAPGRVGRRCNVRRSPRA